MSDLLDMRRALKLYATALAALGVAACIVLVLTVFA